MKVVAIIPARYASQRFPGKVLADLCGKPVIQWVWENVCRSRIVHKVLVCTDDQKVARAAKSFGAEVLMTPSSLQSGTERIVYAVQKYAIKADSIVNVQADEPFLRAKDIDTVACLLQRESRAPIATLKTRLTERIDNPNTVKVVTDTKGYALYFSRLPIPYQRDTMEKVPVRYYQHIGVYAYTRGFVCQYRRLQPSMLESAERLEQLRFLDNGFSIKVGEITHTPQGIDTPEDLQRAIILMRSKRKG